MWEYLYKGGPLVWPILLVSIWALTLILERFFYLRRAKKRYSQESASFFAIYEQHGPSAALESIAKAPQGLVAEILIEAWNPAHNPAAAEKGVEEVLSRHLPKLDKSIATIGTLGSLEPMIGLLGTITGMITSFGALHATGGGDLAEISGGLSVAMINTQLGLCTALPILFAHNFIRNRHRETLSVLQNICARALKMAHKDVSL